MALKKSQQSLKSWTGQKWRTKSGKKSSETGERYLPTAAIKALSPQEYAATTRAKRKGTRAGKQFVKQPKSISKKTPTTMGELSKKEIKRARKEKKNTGRVKKFNEMNNLS